MEKQWRIEVCEGHESLKEALNVDEVIATLLKKRGIHSFEDARAFFRPDLSHLHDPFLMKGMREAIDRIWQAIANDEKVLVYGDYDVDGTTAVSMVYSYFRDKIKRLGYYIPDRYKEGYGISYRGIDYAAENGYSLIIALDCGIKANDKVLYATEKKIDFIICDHHLPGASVPQAVAVLDPKQEGCAYPYKELSGAGIGFKLIQAFSQEHGMPESAYLRYLDLVATSIAADIVPITGENRVLTYFGLEKIMSDPGAGIKALLNINQPKGPVTVSTLVFLVGPRINAAGRLEHGSKAVQLLTEEDYGKALQLAQDVDTTNTLRKDLDLGTTQEAVQLLEQDGNNGKRRTTVLFNNTWHKGVIGIVASRLIDKFYRPTIILTESEGKLTGSARSVREFDVYSAIEKCSDLLDQFGGHKFAAGLSLRPENLQAFTEKFEAVVAETITEEQLVPRIDVDCEIGFHEITSKVLRILKQFAPHGPENMTPMFCTRNVFDTGWGRIFGNNHLKLELFQKDNPNLRFQAVAYEKGDWVTFFQSGRPMDIVYKFQETHNNGVATLQLLIEDLKLSAGS